MWKTRLFALVLLIAGTLIGYFVYSSQVDGSKPFKLGLDLSGGVHLVYSADISSIPAEELNDSLDSLRDVIERRVNLFGVAEPIVQIEKIGVFASDDGESEGRSYRLIVELPGITDVNQAIAMIGATPILEFKKEGSPEKLKAYQEAIVAFQNAQEAGEDPALSQILIDGPYEDTGLTGRFLDRSVLEFDNNTGEPIVSIEFNKEGSELFADITRENVGKIIAIYLDGAPVSEPVVRQEILGGKAQISGNFSIEEAKELVGRLNSGALPIDKLDLLSTQSIGASLGAEAIESGVRAALWGLMLVASFLILWYRLPGLLAVIALSIYIGIVLAIFKLIPVTLTAAGVAGFILSIGLAVDANVLIFERMKEELRNGEKIHDAIREGFARAWLSIRDGNTSSILTAIILFWFGTSLIEGFALTFAIGIIMSMLSAVVVTRTFLLAVAPNGRPTVGRFLFGSGISK